LSDADVLGNERLMRGIKPPKGKQKAPKKPSEFTQNIVSRQSLFQDEILVSAVNDLFSCRDYYRQQGIVKKFGDYGHEGKDFPVLVDFLLALISSNPELHASTFSALKTLLLFSGKQVWNRTILSSIHS
jgi:hypothetical protein